VNGSSDIPPTLLTEIISALILCVTRQKVPRDRIGIRVRIRFIVRVRLVVKVRP
jgi:hypothetical protein